MRRYNHLSFVLILFLISLPLVFQGCNSTDSDTEPEPEPSVNFNSGTIAPDESYSYTFEEELEVEYYCQNHQPDMQGEIIVSSSAEAVERDTVEMTNHQFNPQQLTVAPNTEVIWINHDGENHTVTSGNPSDDNDGGDYDY